MMIIIVVMNCNDDYLENMANVTVNFVGSQF